MRKCRAARQPSPTGPPLRSKRAQTGFRRARGLFTTACALIVLPAAVADMADNDPYLWLEAVTGDTALEWVGERNQRTVEALAATAEFTARRDRFKRILDSEERIAYISKEGEHWYNFWRDAENPRGLWRRTTLDEYRKESPAWETVLDIDALAEREGENWVYKGAEIRRPDFRRCLVYLSRGGADAVVVREFDLIEKDFVRNGFTLPEAKTNVAWGGPDRLFVATDFGPGSLTESGYPRIVKTWVRGGDPADAPVLFEGTLEDVAVSAWADLGNDYRHEFVRRAIDFWNRETWLHRDGKLIPIAAPTSAETAVFRDRLYIRLTEDWTVGGNTHLAGSLLTAPLEAFLDGSRNFETLFTPTPTKSLASYSYTRHHLIVNTLDNVANRVEVLTPDATGWSRRAVPGNEGHQTINVFPVDPDLGDDYFLHIEGFLTPPSLAYGVIGEHPPPGGEGENAPQADYSRPLDGAVEATAEVASPERLKTMPALFDSTGLRVTQHFATSFDGTRVPYFQVRAVEGTGPGPTLLYGYGGFEISLTPAYQTLAGAGWLEPGGTYVLANIRGGGEFGPDWHRAALKENRPLAYRDFIAVAEDLIRRKVTTASQLGVMGGSNGGLLTGNMLTMRPDLFGAVVSQVPLFDMRRYHLLLAGASWMAEYGDPDVPEDWAFIRGFSPYHNLDPEAAYPPVLITTSTRDDRVHPGHARKMVAKLEAMGHDVTYYENIEGGHAGAADNTQSAFMWALAYEFLWKHLGSDPGNPEPAEGVSD